MLNDRPLDKNLLDKRVQLDIQNDSIREAFELVADSLIQVDTRIRGCLISDAPQLTEVARYLLDLGGKRVRPLLVMLSARLFDPRISADKMQKLVDVAAGIELIHMATLLHDDIIDCSVLRRSKTSAYKKYGLCDSLLTGDFLLVKAFGICAKLDQFVIAATERACIELTEGEVLEGKLTTERNLSLDQYLNIIGKKTASLFELSCIVGAHLVQQKPETIELLGKFGRQAGLAFQIVDDVLDVIADRDLLGKPTGTDLLQRTPSVVNILWLNSADKEADRFFNKADAPTAEETAKIIAKLKVSEIVEHARKLAIKEMNLAKQILEKLDSETKSPDICAHMHSLLSYTLNRCL